MIPLWLAFVIVIGVGGLILWWGFSELAKGVKHL